MSTPTSPLPLHQQRCSHQIGPALDAAAQSLLLSQLPGWQVAEGCLRKTFTCRDFHGTMALANAIAWVAHEQDHHPELQLSYRQCTVRWSTHSVGGLSVNDFICAARTEALCS